MSSPSPVSYPLNWRPGLPNLNGSCLALDELKGRDVPTVDMQEIEGVITGRTPRSASVAA